MAQVPRVFVIFFAFLFCCNGKKESTGSGAEQSLTDSSVVADSTPMKKMPDTILVSSLRPLIIRDRGSSDSVVIFPYSLIFRNDMYSTFLVSFNDFSPTLVTLDNHDAILDSMTLIGVIRKEDLQYKRKKYVRITSPSDITVTDSVFSWKTGADGKRISASRKALVTVKKLTISSEGKISR